MDDLESLRTELEHYKAEKEKIRDVIGQIGGRSSKKRDVFINVFFMAAVGVCFLFDLLRHFLAWYIPFLPPSLVLEIAVLLVSVKIIWMIHRQARIDHFQFWILNSIEFQMNIISRRLGGMERASSSSERPGPEGSSDEPAKGAK